MSPGQASGPATVPVNGPRAIDQLGGTINCDATPKLTSLQELNSEAAAVRADLLRDFIFEALAPVECDSAAARLSLSNSDDAGARYHLARVVKCVKAAATTLNELAGLTRDPGEREALMTSPFATQGALRPLRPHQERALEALRRSLASGRRRPMLQMPTGAGKTLLAAHIIRRAFDKGKAYCLLNSCALTRQSERRRL